jgi:multiple sugar transport system ATP-binding protein
MLNIDHVYVAFTKEYYTLNDINLKLNNNQKLVIIGDKESGRTVFLRALLGLENLAKGDVFINNISVSKIDFANDVSVGYIPSNPVFLERKTVEQNIQYLLKIRKNSQSFNDIMVNNALIEFGLNYIKNKKVKDLSYLDRIKLAIARLSIRNIELLLVDDIFSNLSSNEKDKIIKFIKDLIKGNSCASLIMTDSAEVADKFGFNKKYLVYGSLCESKEGINN